MSGSRHGDNLSYTTKSCGLGLVLVAASARGICAILFGDNEAALTAELRDRFPAATLFESDAALDAWAERVVALIDTPTGHFDLPLDLGGTAFQQRVWRALQAIPGGTTLSYAQLAEQIGRPSAVRAVARACASNAIAVAVPCHRVVRSDGALSGYRWGIDRKRALLAREARG